jgi:hypothetical protein
MRWQDAEALGERLLMNIGYKREGQDNEVAAKW